MSRNITYSMTLRSYVYGYSLNSVIALISFSCLFVCNLRRYAWHSDILVDCLCYYKLFRVGVRVQGSL